MNRTQVFLAIGAVLVLIAVAVWLSFPRTAISPSPAVSEPPPAEASTATPPSTKVVPVNPTSTNILHPLPLAKGDSIALWDFKGAYTGNPELVAKAQTEIKRLSVLLTATTSSVMELSVSIANDYELLGQGREQYEYLGRAIRADRTIGLPWHNLGVLMERLGAFTTARTAYEKATLLQPQLSVYQYAYLEFLIRNMKNDTAGIEKAFSAAEASLGNDSYVAYLLDEWQKQ